MTIHTPIESPYRVDLKNVVFKNVQCDSWPKNPKTCVKKSLFIRISEK
jgi:hypothetical protein